MTRHLGSRYPLFLWFLFSPRPIPVQPTQASDHTAVAQSRRSLLETRQKFGNDTPKPRNIRRSHTPDAIYSRPGRDWKRPVVYLDFGLGMEPRDTSRFTSKRKDSLMKGFTPKVSRRWWSWVSSAGTNPPEGAQY